jgi:putative peptidoglycan lipid II flippase
VALKWVVVISVPAAAALAVLAIPLLATMFNYREFGANDVVMSAYALRAYAIGLVGFVFVKVLAPGFFARQDTATPVRVGVIAMLVNVALSLALFWWLAHVGLALATSVAAIVNALMLGMILRRERVLVIDRALLPIIFRTVAATVAMSILLWVLAGPDSNWLEAGIWTRVGRLVICVASGLIVYAGVLFVIGLRPRDLAIHDA